MSQELKERFYSFSQLMAKDSKILYDQEAWHNSVYFAGYVLEGYIKFLLIKSGATTYQGNRDNSYGGHINSLSFINRLSTTNPNLFNSSLLEQSNLNYPELLLNGRNNNIGEDKWDINYRYEVNRWKSQMFAEDVQLEVDNIKQALALARIDGVL
jgi:hypothetical protein